MVVPVIPGPSVTAPKATTKQRGKLDYIIPSMITQLTLFTGFVNHALLEQRLAKLDQIWSLRFSKLERSLADIQAQLYDLKSTFETPHLDHGTVEEQEMMNRIPRSPLFPENFPETWSLYHEPSSVESTLNANLNDINPHIDGLSIPKLETDIDPPAPMNSNYSESRLGAP